jgi:di/tricarboxylate transporter
MSFASYFVLLVFIGTIVGLIKFQNKPTAVFGVVLLVLYASEMVTTGQILASMSNQGLATLILLMLCSLALEKTRLLRVVATHVIKKDYQGTWLRLFGLTVLSSGILNNTAVVSTLLAPIRNNPHHKASKLLLPLSYAAILGGTLTLVGTSTHLIVNSLVLDAGLPSLGFFDFTLVGLSLVLVCGAMLWCLSQWLPEREIEKVMTKSYLIDAKVKPSSSLIGKSIEQNGLRHLESLFLVEIIRCGRLLSPVSPAEVIQEDDRLVFSGDVTKVMQLSHFDGLSIFADDNGLPLSNLTEVVLRQESVLIGKSLKESGFRARFDAAVVAIKRDGAQVSGKLGDVVLQSGDYLVLAVGEDFKTRHNIGKNFITISGVEPDTLLKGNKEWLVAGGFFASILLAATDVFPLFKCLFVLLGVLIFSRCLTVNEIIRRFPVDIWLIISAALVLSLALSNSGALESIDYLINTYATGLSALGALIVIYVCTCILTELVTNNAAAALMFPLAYALSLSLDANPMAFIMTVAFGASASFISPYGYQTNLMVFNAGRYQLSDFVKFGVPMSLVYGVVAVTAIVQVFGLSAA